MTRSATAASTTTGRNGIGKGLVIGAVAGIVASVFMGMYAMVASYLKDTGFFTPLHHIASLFAPPEAMMESMMGAMEQGDTFVLSAGTAVLGLLIHMMVGAIYGAVFGAAVALVPQLSRAIVTGLGVVWGGVVFLVSAFIGLPLAAAIVGVGDLPDGNPIADMAQMAGWGVFLTEHLLFGLVLGVVVAFGMARGAAARR